MSTGVIPLGCHSECVKTLPPIAECDDNSRTREQYRKPVGADVISVEMEKACKHSIWKQVANYDA